MVVMTAQSRSTAPISGCPVIGKLGQNTVHASVFIFVPGDVDSSGCAAAAAWPALFQRYRKHDRPEHRFGRIYRTCERTEPRLRLPTDDQWQMPAVDSCSNSDGSEKRPNLR